MLSAPELSFVMEAHDGLSARIAQVEGFDALWASGFSMSTTLGVRDAEEASWSQLLSVVGYMTEASSAPIVVDGDAGYGGFNTARRFALKVSRVGAAAVCFEDKQFPKMNSFVGDKHELASIAEFSTKIRACKEYQEDAEFCLIARTEALIAGRSVDEALERAHAYADAGADALFIHSRLATVEQIQSFAEEWDGLPLIIAPTTYAATPTDVFRKLGISAVIWANHSMRASVAAMRSACREIQRNESVSGMEVPLASLAEVFHLMGYDELDATERRLLLSAHEMGQVQEQAG